MFNIIRRGVKGLDLTGMMYKIEQLYVKKCPK